MKNCRIITMLPDNFLLAILVLLQIIALSCALDNTFESHVVNRFTIQDALDLLPAIRGGTSDSAFNQTEARINAAAQGKDPTVASGFVRDARGLPLLLRPKHANNPKLDYADILHGTSPGGSIWDQSEDEDDQNPLDPSPMKIVDKDIFNSDSDTDFDGSGRFLGGPIRSHSPVVYRYYGRNRSRGQNSIPFILLGPNVDHWREVGQILAARGFSVMACERVDHDKDHPIRLDDSDDGPNLVLEILDALRWNRAILVGCDRESLLAMKTAMHLAPDKVAGLILCGDLSDANRLASEAGSHDLDAFLRTVLGCPFTIVWNGDTSGPSSPPHSNDRVLILGAGTAPHRRRAEQFAWVLTRFVEEKLAPLRRKKPHVAPQETMRSRFARRMSNFSLPLGLEPLGTSEGRLVLGRSIATALFYIAVMRVTLVQYGMLQSGLIEIKAKYDTVDELRRNILRAVGGFIVNYGYIPRLFSLKKAAEDDDDDLLNQNVITLKSDSQTDASETDSSDEDVDVDEGEKEETLDDDSQRDSANDEDALEDDEQPIFRPPFLLDYVIT
jgi:pimeloyl-ACP methyl ester carboxylesterase